MKKIIIASLLALIVVISSVVVVVSASEDNSQKTEVDKKEQMQEKIEQKAVENYTMATNDIIEQVYEANGFNESDRRYDTESVITSSDNSSNLRRIKSINSEINKSYIYDRMLNSIDYFSSLQATYYHIPSTGYSYYSTYCIQQGDNPKSKELIFNENGELVSSCSFDGEFSANINGDAESTKVDAGLKKKKSKSVNLIQNKSIEEKIIKNRMNSSIKEINSENENAIYEKLPVDIESSEKLDFVSLVDSKKRIKYIPEEKEDCYFYRNNLPQLPMSNTQYFSQAFAFGFLSDFDKWDIDRTDEVLGRECFVISGEIAGDYSEKVNADKFEMWIDKEIGALLTLECYDKNSNLSSLLTTSEFIVDESIDQSVFDDLSKIN